MEGIIIKNHILQSLLKLYHLFKNIALNWIQNSPNGLNYSGLLSKVAKLLKFSNLY